MLEEKSLQLLRDKKNLLAFSGGGDSTALFFLLLQNNISFAIAIVDYGVREQSKEEVAHAMELAKIHNLACHVFHAPKIETNFEAKAREIRYDFFEELIKKYGYENLITAHHLGDRMEWLLMQFCKGAGCVELVGMQRESKKNGYTLLRPLLHLDKQELLHFLEANKITYFEDATNFDESIKRNEFRHNYAAPLLAKYLGGIKKSFEYLDADKNLLLNDEVVVHAMNKEFFSIKRSHNQRSEIHAIDQILKSLGYMLSANERELLQKEESLVVGRKFLICSTKAYIFIAPYKNEKRVMQKEFKEKMRKMRIPAKLRPYLEQNQDTCYKVEALLNTI